MNVSEAIDDFFKENSMVVCPHYELLGRYTRLPKKDCQARHEQAKKLEDKDRMTMNTAYTKGEGYITAMDGLRGCLDCQIIKEEENENE